MSDLVKHKKVYVSPQVQVQVEDEMLFLNFCISVAPNSTGKSSDLKLTPLSNLYFSWHQETAIWIFAFLIPPDCGL